MSITSPPAQAPPRTPIPEPAPVAVLPVTGLGVIREGDDHGALLASGLAPLSPVDGDVLCVSTKIVSKALGLRVAPEDRDDAIRAEAEKYGLEVAFRGKRHPVLDMLVRIYDVLHNVSYAGPAAAEPAPLLFALDHAS